MSNAIDFLERMGQDAHLRYAVSSAMAAALAQAEVAQEVRGAILGADAARLESLLGASANICCMVRHNENDDEDADTDDGNDQDGDENDDDDDAGTHRALAYRGATP